ncbi:hypothetical protein SDC9_21026 [bioreactor metagenome]|jgi:hypothetical protein|uniref:Uncharacterized protein n=1 Tax=bioreactor metagenome TaxID=1076179 RepID=A0A644U8C9_9ZZZZ|nr:hypothetical protein [Lentimicrobium sp.]MEA5109916.1 hypothetical protein [Lentimicrobium sp.]
MNPQALIKKTAKNLPINFIYKGDLFTRVFEKDDWYIYKRNYAGMEYYEVFMRKIIRCVDFNTKIPTGEYRELYPKDEHFGRWAWCCRTFEKALAYTNGGLDNDKNILPV